MLIYPNTAIDEQNNKNSSPPSSSGLPEEELITSQDWSCYGSTELDLLVLRPQGETEEKIVAVSKTNFDEDLLRRLTQPCVSFCIRFHFDFVHVCMAIPGLAVLQSRTQPQRCSQ